MPSKGLKRKQQARAWYLATRDRVLAQRKADHTPYTEQEIIARREAARRYRASHPEFIEQKKQKLCEKNKNARRRLKELSIFSETGAILTPDEVAERDSLSELCERINSANRKWSREHPDRTNRTAYPKEVQRARDAKYRKDNLSKVKARTKMRRERNKGREIPIEKKLVQKVRGRISKLVSRRKFTKAASTLEIIGCSPIELMAHLEAQFVDGMSWENYGRGDGKWHIDHIRPCASFNLMLPEEQAKCFHYTNLQPLWEIDNLIKGAKFLTPENSLP